MQIYSLYQVSIYIELTINQLKEAGISSIFVIPLDDFDEHPQLFDSIDRSDGVSFINIGMALAVVFSTIFASKGFEWQLGPIIWGLIGASGGFILGVLIDILLYRWKNRSSKRSKEKGNLLILVIECEKKDEKMATKILAENRALGFAKIEQISNE